MRRECLVDTCKAPSRSSGFCERHYYRWKRYGDPLKLVIGWRRLGKCSVEKCQKPIFARGFCGTHYARWRKHGDPLKTLKKSRPPGIISAWVAQLPREGTDCISWPFRKNDTGYGCVYVGNGRRGEGRHMIASRYVCEVFHGPPPEPAYQTAHECGKGHLGCVAPYHLSWKTRLENTADMERHGTRHRGEAWRLARGKEKARIAG